MLANLAIVVLLGLNHLLVALIFSAGYIGVCSQVAVSPAEEIRSVFEDI